MDRNAYIWLLLVINQRHDKRDKRPSTLTNRPVPAYASQLCAVSHMRVRMLLENSMIDDSCRKRIVILFMH